MQLTVTSVMSMVFFSLCFAVLLEVILRCDKLLVRIKYELLLACMVVPVLKIIVPTEVLAWTHNVLVTRALPDIVKAVNKDAVVIAGSKITFWNLVLAVMLAGALIKAVVVMCSYLLFRRFVNKAPIVEDVRAEMLVKKIVGEQKRDVKIVLKRTKEGESPRISGFLHPCILLPDEKYSEMELECILRHEIAHWMCGDMIIRLGWIMIKILCWWNPAVYILDNQFEQLLEIRADENAVKTLNNDSGCDYMETLVKVANGVKVQGKGNNYCASFREKRGIPVQRRVKLMLGRDGLSCVSVLISNLAGAACLISLAVVMNVVIFEPKGETPVVENYEGSKTVTSSDYFLVKNADGTFDMYMGGVYCATVKTDLGSDMGIYNSLEEAMEYAEIK